MKSLRSWWGIRAGAGASARARSGRRAACFEPLEGRTFFDGAAALDLSFGGADGRARVDVAGLRDSGWVVHALPDGKLLVAGNATFNYMTNLPPGLAAHGPGGVSIAGTERGFVARLNADGSLDPTFGDGGVAPQPSDPFEWPDQSRLPDYVKLERLWTLAVGPDGKISLGGTSKAYTPFGGTSASWRRRVGAGAGAEPRSVGTITVAARVRRGRGAPVTRLTVPAPQAQEQAGATALVREEDTDREGSEVPRA